MPLEIQNGIDKTQAQIDKLDNILDKKVIKDGKDYSNQFLAKVDKFQEKIENLNTPKNLKEKHLKKILKFLKGVDANNIEKAASSLDSKLNNFIQKIDVFSKKQRSTYEIQKGDYLSTISQYCFNKEGKQLRWKELYDANKDNLRSGNPNLIFPGEKLNIPNGYSYFNKSEVLQLEIKPPELGQKPAVETKSKLDKPGAKRSPEKERFLETDKTGKQPADLDQPKHDKTDNRKADQKSEGASKQIEEACQTEKQTIEQKLATMESNLGRKEYKTLQQANERLIKSKSDTVDKESSQELLDNFLQFDARLSEINNQINKQKESGEIAGHGEIEKTIVRSLRKIPFLANFTPVGMVTGLAHSIVGAENATAKEKALEGAKFVASIIPVAGNFVDLTEGIYGLMTGKRMGTDIPQTTGEALFAIGIGIGGLAIDVLTLGTMGAPIKAAFKAGWKIGIKKLPGLIIKGAKDYIAKHGLEALQKPLGAAKDAGVWLSETFVVGPGKFVWKSGKAVLVDGPKALWKNRKAIASGAKEIIKNPVQSSKKALAVVAGGTSVLWSKTKTWWKNRGENKNKSVDEKIAEVRTIEQERLSNLGEQNKQLRKDIDVKQKEIERLEGKEKRKVEKELSEMKKRQAEIVEQIETKKTAIEGVDQVSTSVKAKTEKKVQKVESDITQRGEFLKEISITEVGDWKNAELKGIVVKIDSEIKLIDSVLDDVKNLPDETISSLNHQRKKLVEAKIKYDIEWTGRIEYARKYFIDRINNISESIKNLFAGIKKLGLNLDGLKNISKKIGELDVLIGALKNKLPKIPDLNLRKKVGEQVKKLEDIHVNLKERVKSKTDELKKNDDEIIEKKSDTSDETATNRLVDSKIIEAKINKLKTGDVIISHSGTKRTITAVEEKHFAVDTEKGGRVFKEIIDKDELTAKNNKWVKEARQIETRKAIIAVNEEVYVKRSNGTVEKGWLVERVNPDGSYALKNPKENLSKNISPNKVWSLGEIERKNSDNLLKDNAALLEKRKLEVLEKYTTLSKRSFNSMFGNWNAIRQQNVGNCYLIASLNSLRESPHFEVLIRTSVKEVKGGWEVKIPLGSSDATPLFIGKNDLKPQLNPNYNKANKWGKVDDRKYLNPVNAPKGYKILEAAFIKQVLGGELYRYKIEGGFGHQALLSLLDNNFKKVKASGSDKVRDPRYTYMQYGESPVFNKGTELGKKKLVQFLDSYDSAKFIATANTPSSAKGDRGIFTVNGIKFATGHAYSIVNVDKFSKNVFISNPWDTSKIIQLSYEDFTEVFNQVSAVEVKHNQLLENLGKIQKAA
jgi:hypothetical protein